MKAKMVKWGNTLAVRIPKPVAKEAKAEGRKFTGNLFCSAPRCLTLAINPDEASYCNLAYSVLAAW
jgi:hypothetical protein